MAQTLASSAQTVRVATRAATTARVVARAPFFTGAKLQTAARAVAPAARQQARTMALFGGAAATKGGIYEYTVKVGRGWWSVGAALRRTRPGNGRLEGMVQVSLWQELCLKGVSTAPAEPLPAGH